MNLLTALSPLLTLLFGGLVLYLSYTNRRARKKESEREQELKTQLFERSVLKDMHDKITYSLSVEKSTDIILESLHKLFPRANIASVSLKNGKVVFKMHLRERIGPYFIQYVKTNLLASFPDSNKHDEIIEECVYEVSLDEHQTYLPGSFFRVPLIVDKTVAGVVGIASLAKDQFGANDLRLLDQLVGEAGSSLSHMKHETKKEEEQALMLIEHLPNAVFMVDQDHTLSLINQKARKLLSITKPRPTTLDVATSLSQVIDLPSLLRDVLLYEKKCDAKEITLNNYPYQLEILPIYRPHAHSASGAVVILRDISVEKQKSQMKEDFTNMMVHELRSPLTAMKGASQFLKSNPNMDRESRNKLLTIIDEESKHLLYQITLILDAAKLDAGRLTVDKTISDITKVLTEHAELFSPQAKMKNITITTDIKDTLPPFPFDTFRIGQVIDDLISNSLKYTYPGGTIALSAKRDNGYAMVSVSDNGIGIPKDKQASLFSKFSFLGHNSDPLAKKAVTSGLGLYIAKGVIEAHGGTISLVSSENQGTTVTFRLPVGEAKAEVITASFKHTTASPRQNLQLN
ncbi:MAG: GAF domain-containing sensor histidine kinase [Candidatus Levybacteria bacterium]|nr:GAF domain-containing sensor histidine kinase [Candidatus Levybacteria bacterium]